MSDITYKINDTMVVPWRISDTEIIHLLTPDELASLPDGTVVYSITGTAHQKGADRLDDDTRFGRTAFGLLVKKDKKLS